MIKHSDSKQKFITSFVVALIVHAAIISLVRKPLSNYDFLANLSEATRNLKQPIKVEDIKFISPSEVEKFRKVGIKDGKKDLQRPDIVPKQTVKTKPVKASPNPLSLDKLAPELPKPQPTKVVENQNPKKGAPGKPSSVVLNEPVKKTQNDIAKDFLNVKPSTETGGNFYFNYKNNKVIEQNQEQEIIKSEAQRNFTAPQNKATDRISNFEIRYERPEGVSEDELNSDEKAYYSFYVRSYQNYFSKIYANYEKIVIERPGLAGVFDKKHLLIGKIDYDEKGNIVTVRILKSSENDDLHYFFEETLKQLSQPNPPKVFTKNRKQFSIFYQLQIN